MKNGVLFLAQSLGSPTTQAIESQAVSDGILIGTAAQDSAFVNKKVNAVIGTPYAVDMANAVYYTSQQSKGASVALAYQNDAYGQDGIKGYTAAVSAYGLKSVAKVPYNVTDTSFTSQALALKRSGAKYVFVTAIPTAAGTLIGTAAALGYHPQWVLQGPAWSEFLMTSTGTPKGTPTPIEKALQGAWVMGYLAQWGDTSVPGMADFLKAAGNTTPDAYFEYGYCLALMEKDVIAKALSNNDLTRQGILNAKLNLGTVDFQGLMPNANYTPALGPADRETEISAVDANAGASGFLKVTKSFFTSSVGQSLKLGS
jgi:ABC-type branched-subunit amino acid transport system substrate-binding protein